LKGGSDVDSNDYFCKIPKHYINDNTASAEILVFRCLSYLNVPRQNRALVSVDDIISLSGYSLTYDGRTRILNKDFIISVLKNFVQDGKIELLNCSDFVNVVHNTQMAFRLNPNVFNPSDQYVVLNDSEWDKIVLIKSRIPKYELLRVFLYLKSFMASNTEIITKQVCACYRGVDKIAQDLNMTRKHLDKIIGQLIKCGLIIKHEVGSYFSKAHKKIQNAPNVYVLASDKNVKQHIQDGINRLQYNLGVSEFMPIVHKGKKIKKRGHTG
jgi:predicted transcriptional regulator